MKPQAKNSVNFTIILPAFVHKTSGFPLYQNLGGGAQIFLNQAQYFRLCFCLLTAQAFRKYVNHIESSNNSMPGLLIT